MKQRASLIGLVGLFLWTSLSSAQPTIETRHGICAGTKLAGEVSLYSVSQTFELRVRRDKISQAGEELKRNWADFVGCDPESRGLPCECFLGATPSDTSSIRQMYSLPQTLNIDGKEIRLPQRNVDFPMDRIRSVEAKFPVTQQR
jgi:hypothetical protein